MLSAVLRGLLRTNAEIVRIDMASVYAHGYGCVHIKDIRIKCAEEICGMKKMIFYLCADMSSVV